MVNEVLLMAAMLGAGFRIWDMDGYKIGIFFLNGVFQMGVLMSFIIGIGAAILAVQTGIIPMTGDPVTDFLVTFFTAFTVPFTIDRFITKSPIGNPKEPEVTTTPDEGA